MKKQRKAVLAKVVTILFMMCAAIMIVPAPIAHAAAPWGVTQNVNANNGRKVIINNLNNTSIKFTIKNTGSQTLRINGVELKKGESKTYTLKKGASMTYEVLNLNLSDKAGSFVITSNYSWVQALIY